MTAENFLDGICITLTWMYYPNYIILSLPLQLQNNIREQAHTDRWFITHLGRLPVVFDHPLEFPFADEPLTSDGLDLNMNTSQEMGDLCIPGECFLGLSLYRVDHHHFQQRRHTLRTQERKRDSQEPWTKKGTSTHDQVCYLVSMDSGEWQIRIYDALCDRKVVAGG